MSTTYVDREGYEWKKQCETCHRYEYVKNASGKVTGDVYCRAYSQNQLSEPFKTYVFNTPVGQNDCPHYIRTDRRD
jgi:hypothetical protein